MYNAALLNKAITIEYKITELLSLCDFTGFIGLDGGITKISEFGLGTL